MLQALRMDMRKLLRTFVRYWPHTGEQVRKNCLTHALNRLNCPNCFTTRNVVMGAALARRADQLGGRSGHNAGDSYIRVVSRGRAITIAWPKGVYWISAGLT